MFYSDRADVEKLAARLCDRIQYHAQAAPDFKTWTTAVHRALKECATGQGWKIIPEEKCYSGEYHCDFMLFEEQYGCRIACESQWNHGASHQAALDWAFDKLRGVKSDLKLFIFEGTHEEWEKVVGRYLKNYAQLPLGETYLALRWHSNKFTKWFWTVTEPGLQKREIVFECIGETEAPEEPHVIEKYGNNAAVRCRKCSRIFLVSSLVNKNGRICPGCSSVIVRFNSDGKVIFGSAQGAA